VANGKCPCCGRESAPLPDLKAIDWRAPRNASERFGMAPRAPSQIRVDGSMFTEEQRAQLSAQGVVFR
jgi:hypothetical protein